MSFARVALPLPLPDSLHLPVPESLADRVVPGARVVVPVRRQEMVGIVTALDVAAPGWRPATSSPRRIPSPRSPRRCSRPSGLDGALLRRAAGLALRAMLPPGLWGSSTAVLGLRERVAERRGRRRGSSTGSSGGADRRRSAPPRAALQASALGRGRPAGPGRRLDARARASRHRQRGAVTERVIALPAAAHPARARGALRAPAAAARPLRGHRAARGARRRGAHLVGAARVRDGVLRSLLMRGAGRGGAGRAGARSVRRACRAHRRPTRSTDDQREALGAARGPGAGRGDAALRGDRERQDAGLPRGHPARRSPHGPGRDPPGARDRPDAADGEPGPRRRSATRSRCCTAGSRTASGPTPGGCSAAGSGAWRSARGPRSSRRCRDLGLIVVDEEHEASYKNGEAPRYHAREVAAVRARLEGARFVLGSATPSLETHGRRSTGRGSGCVRLPGAGRRAAAAAGRAGGPAHRAAGARAPARCPGRRRSTQRCRAALARGEQALLLLNRRGFAAFLQCRACGAVPECPNCSISPHGAPAPPGAPLPLLRAPARRCPTACAACGHAVQVARGVGTQQLEQLVAERFPDGAAGADGPRHDEHPLGAPPDPRRDRAGARSTSCSAPR